MVGVVGLFCLFVAFRGSLISLILNLVVDVVDGDGCCQYQSCHFFFWRSTASFDQVTYLMLCCRLDRELRFWGV